MDVSVLVSCKKVRENHLLLLRHHLGSICHLFSRRKFAAFCFPTLNETFSCKCRYPSSGSCRAVTVPAWTWCDVGSRHTRQCFAKTHVWGFQFRFPVAFTLPPCVFCYHKPVSQCDHQWAILDFYSLPSSADCQSKPRQRMHHLMFLQENVTVGARKKRSSSALSLCLQLGCQSHSSWFGPGHWHFCHWKADPVNIKQLPEQILSVSTMSSL